MGIADHSCAPAPSRAILPEEAVGAGALDSPFLGAARFEFIQTCGRPKVAPTKKSSPQGDTIIPHSSLDKR